MNCINIEYYIINNIERLNIPATEAIRNAIFRMIQTISQQMLVHFLFSSIIKINK